MKILPATATLILLTFCATSHGQDAGIRKYGNVEFADPIHHKYPIDTARHIRAAWAYIHRKKNAEKYSENELQQIYRRIKNAATKHRITLHQ